MDLENKKILVTGGLGFIGSHTVLALLERGACIVVVDNLPSADIKSIDARIKFYDLDIASASLGKVFKREIPEIVYHFAFDISLHKSLGEDIGRESVKAISNLLENCNKYGVKKFILASSGAVYGNPENFPINEGDPMKPVAPYGVIKILVEDCVKKLHGLNYVILRYATVYGPGQRGGAMSDYIRKLSSGEQADVWGDGSKTRDYVYINDVVRANLLALQVPDDFEDPVFNVSTGVETTLNDLYYKVAELLSKKADPRYLPDRPGELMRYQLDYSKIKRVLGWEPEYSLEKGLKKRLHEENLI